MRTLQLLLIAIFITGNLANAQNNYFSIQKEGTNYNFNPDNSNTIIGSGNDDKLSSEQQLPFDINFFGDSVKTYYASDNGYITFTDTAKKSQVGSSPLSQSSAPKNSIFGFWSDLKLASSSSRGTEDEVLNFTYTNDANVKVHVIQWKSVSKNSSSRGYYYFSIRIYETGVIDIVHNYAGFQQGEGIQGAVGLKNKDGSKVKEIGNSPNINFPDLAGGGSDDDVYYFRKGSQPKYDVAISDIDLSGKYVMDKTVLTGKSSKVKAGLFNFGSEAVNSLTINYTLNGGSVKTKTVNNLNFSASGGNGSFGFTPSNLQTGQEYQIEWWIDQINGNNDEYKNNNKKLNRNYFINNGQSTTKNPLIEEFSTAPCGYCPDGKRILENIKTNTPQSIVAQHHAAFGTDKMTIQEHQSYASGMGISSAPSAMIDRTNFFEQGIRLSRGDWPEKTQQRLNFPSPVKVNIKNENPEKDKLKVTIDAEFLAQVPKGDLRVTAFLVQNTVVGEGDGWDQRNYYNQVSQHPYGGKGDPIKGYEHKDVVRDVITSTWGDGGFIPNEPKVGETYSTTLNYDFSNQDIPNLYHEDGHKVVAFVHYYDNNKNNRIVLNSNEEAIKGMTLARENEPNKKRFGLNKIFPNPAETFTQVDFTLEESRKVSLNVYSAVGQHVKEVVSNRKYVGGQQSIAVNVKDLKPGLYIAKLKVDGQTVGEQFMVK